MSQEFTLPGVGRVQYDVTKIPHFCGGAVIHRVRFNLVGTKTENKKAQLYDGFHEHLRTAHYNLDIDRCKLIMCDSVNDGTTAGDGSIYQFCCHAGWWVGPETLNQKTNRKVVIFELERQCISHQY